MEAQAGGTCPECGGNNVYGTLYYPPTFYCRDCGHNWELYDRGLMGCITGCSENCKTGCWESNKK